MELETQPLFFCNLNRTPPSTRSTILAEKHHGAHYVQSIVLGQNTQDFKALTKVLLYDDCIWGDNRTGNSSPRNPRSQLYVSHGVSI